MDKIRVVLAEDNVLLREGVARLIAVNKDFELVGTAANLPELLALVGAEHPDVVVTDIRMPPTGTYEGIQASSWLRENHPEVGVVVLSQFAAPWVCGGAPRARLGGPGLPAQGAGGQCGRAGSGGPRGSG